MSDINQQRSRVLATERLQSLEVRRIGIHGEHRLGDDHDSGVRRFGAQLRQLGGWVIVVEVPEAVCFLIDRQTFAPRFRRPISHDVGVTWLAHNDPS